MTGVNRSIFQNRGILTVTWIQSKILFWEILFISPEYLRDIAAEVVFPELTVILKICLWNAVQVAAFAHKSDLSVCQEESVSGAWNINICAEYKLIKHTRLIYL